METEKSALEQKVQLSASDFEGLKSKEEYIKLCRDKGFDIDKHIDKFAYESELLELQAELVNLQKFVVKKRLKSCYNF